MRGLASLAQPTTEARLWNDGGIPWFSRGTKITIDQWNAYTLSAVFACETLIADAIATLPVDTFRKQGGLRTPTTPPAWIETPNPENNRIDYETQRVLSLLSWGNAYTYLVRKYGTSDLLDPVVERWLLNPATVNVLRTHAQDETSSVLYFHRGMPVEPGNIQHIRGYVPPGFFLGMSVISMARTGLDMTASAEAAGANLYDQGMSQSGVISVPQLPSEVSSDVTDRIVESVMERNAGAGNAGKPLILTGGSEWKPSMMTPSDAQYLETRKFQINEICRWFRVSPHLVQDIVAHASQGGGMGIEQQATEFAQYTLRPWVERLELADSALVARGQYVKYNLNASVRADMATRYEAYTKARLGGWSSADEIRELEDQPPIPDGKGKIFLQPANYIEAGTTPATPVSGPIPEPAQGA